MKHIILLFYIFCFSTGVSSLLLSVFIYFKHRIEVIKYFIFFSLILNINAGMIMSSFYLASFYRGEASLLFSIFFKYSLFISAGLILYPIFIFAINLCRARPANFKKIVLGSAVLLIPNLVFSSSNIRSQLIDKFQPVNSQSGILLILCSAILVYMFVFIISGSDEAGKVKKNPLLLTLLLSSYTLLVFILLDYTRLFFPGGFSGPVNNISLTVAGYFLLCVSTIVFSFRHYAKSRPIAAVTNPAIMYLDATGITKRELEIIGLIIKGFSNRQIGDKLFISVSTVKKHIYSIFRKTHVKSRMALTALIRKN